MKNMNIDKTETTGPLVTVIVLSFQQNKTIFECLSSIVSQTYTNFELIICDDGTPDFPKIEIENFLQHERPLLSTSIIVNDTNVGTVRNSNIGISCSAGELIKFLAADDLLYENETIEKIITEFHDSSLDLLCGRGKSFGTEKTLNKIYPTEPEFMQLSYVDAEGLYKILCSRPWSSLLAPGVTFRTDFLKSLGGFDSNFKYLEDWPFWIKAAKANATFKMTEEIVVWYRENGISSISPKSTYGQNIRLKYLMECCQVLEEEAMNLWRNSKTIWLSSKLSIGCLKLRMLNTTNSPLSFLKKIGYLPSFFYKKLIGAIGNNKRIPPVFCIFIFIFSVMLSKFADFPFKKTLILFCVISMSSCLIFNLLVVIHLKKIVKKYNKRNQQQYG